MLKQKGLQPSPIPLHIILIQKSEFCGDVENSGQSGVELGWKWEALSHEPLRETVGYLFNQRVAMQVKCSI